jgi:hypothetical protein
LPCCDDDVMGSHAIPSPDNLILQDVQYAVTETKLGRWRRYAYLAGALFEKFLAFHRLFGLPTLHYTRGKCPETSKRIVAKGIIAIGRLAVGVIAIGHPAVGVIAIGQLGLGLLLGLGQLTSDFACLGQMASGFGAPFMACPY